MQLRPSLPQGLLEGVSILLQSGGLGPKAVPCLSAAWEAVALQKGLLFALKVPSPSRGMGHYEFDH